MRRPNVGVEVEQLGVGYVTYSGAPPSFEFENKIGISNPNGYRFPPPIEFEFENLKSGSKVGESVTV